MYDTTACFNNKQGFVVVSDRHETGSHRTDGRALQQLTCFTHGCATLRPLRHALRDVYAVVV